MKKAFTLLELIIVVIILGILVSIALPRFQATREKARVTEGLQLVGQLRRAQLSYYNQTGVWAVTTNLATIEERLNIGFLGLRYFDPSSISVSEPTEFYGISWIVNFRRNTVDLPSGFLQYYLFIDIDGAYRCYTDDVPTDNNCEQLGIPRLQQ